MAAIASICADALESAGDWKWKCSDSIPIRPGKCPGASPTQCIDALAQPEKSQYGSDDDNQADDEKAQGQVLQYSNLVLR